MLSRALRTVVRAISIRVGDLFQVTLDRTGEWVYNAVCIVMQGVPPTTPSVRLATPLWLFSTTAGTVAFGPCRTRRDSAFLAGIASIRRICSIAEGTRYSRKC